MNNFCVVCGADIPEGLQVCKNCEYGMPEFIQIYCKYSDLLDYNHLTGAIRLDKNIFNRFESKKCVDIHFTDTSVQYPVQYVMVSEDDNSIYMELLSDNVY